MRIGDHDRHDALQCEEAIMGWTVIFIPIFLFILLPIFVIIDNNYNNKSHDRCPYCKERGFLETVTLKKEKHLTCRIAIHCKLCGKVWKNMSRWIGYLDPMDYGYDQFGQKYKKYEKWREMVSLEDIDTTLPGIGR